MSLEGSAGGYVKTASADLDGSNFAAIGDDEGDPFGIVVDKALGKYYHPTGETPPFVSSTNLDLSPPQVELFGLNAAPSAEIAHGIELGCAP